MSIHASSPTNKLRNLLLTAALTLSVLGCSPAFSPPDQPVTTLAETGRVYALLDTRAAAADLKNASRALGYEPRDPIDLGGLSLVMVPVDLPENVTGLEAINALEDAVPSSTVGVNHAYRLQQTTPASFDRRAYANTLLNWPQGGCRAQTAIGLIDGGIDAAAPIFSGVDVRTRDFADGNTASRQHGTDVASVMVDPSRLRDVSLFSANVIGTNEDGENVGGAAALVQAIDWMASQNVRLINISLSGPTNKLLAQAVEAAQNRNIIMVAAVGNDGATAPAQFPAAFSGVIAVTALDADQRIFRRAVRGPHVDFAAPGVDIYVNAQNGGRYVSGTSMAAPFVTAYLAAKAERTMPLRASAKDLGALGRDTTFGNGLIQAADGC